MELSRSSHQMGAISGQIQNREDSVYVAQYALKEAFEHAKTVERLLFELQSRLRGVEDEICRMKARVRLQVGEGQRLDGSIVDSRIRHQERVEELHKRISYLSEETNTDRDEKIRLLRIIDMFVNGGPSPTLADWSFYHYVNQIGSSGYGQGALPLVSAEQHLGQHLTSGSSAALSFARTMGSLAESNGWLLERQQFFAFAAGLLHSGVLQHRKGYRVDVESNAISAAVFTEVNVALVQVLSAMDDADLAKL